ncbi:MAG: hypothetical protein OHK0029_22220 [Armatimonadaceae bacterium]
MRYLAKRVVRLLDLASAHLEKATLDEETRYDLELAAFDAETVLRQLQQDFALFTTQLREEIHLDQRLSAAHRP